MLLVANLAITKWCEICWNLTETLAHGYSSDSTQQEPSDEYMAGFIKFFKYFCALVPLTKVASALKGLMLNNHWRSTCVALYSKSHQQV